MKTKSLITGLIFAQFLAVCSLSAIAEEIKTPPLKAGAIFQDCQQCPSMIVVPSGKFLMGVPVGEEGSDKKETPQHKVTIQKPFAVGRYEVTYDQWQACLNENGCMKYEPYDQGWGKGKRPVINVNWYHVQSYLRWLRQKTGKKYRLLSEAEWEYMARAGTNTTHWWGNDKARDHTNYGKEKCCGGAADGADKWVKTAPVGQFKPNPFGIYDSLGNVSEWVSDCFHRSYKDAPNDGNPWLNDGGGNCLHHILRGGAWGFPKSYIRAARRGSTFMRIKNRNYGFRVALDLNLDLN